MYESVKKEEFKVPGGEGDLAETFFNPEREGWLTKEGGKYKSKHKRWFILKSGILYYFKQPTVSWWGGGGDVAGHRVTSSPTGRKSHWKYSAGGKSESPSGCRSEGCSCKPRFQRICYTDYVIGDCLCRT